MKSRDSNVPALSLSLVSVAASSCAIAFFQWPHLQKLSDSSDVLSQDTLMQQVEQESLRLDLWAQTPLVGFDNLMADWAFLSFLQYFGDDEVRARTDYALSPKYFEVILDKDPYFWDAYLFLSASTTIYAAQPDRTIAIMEQSIPNLSPPIPDRSYFIWRWKATDELLFLNDPDAAITSYQTAASWASEYDTEEGQFIAQISQHAADFLKINPTSKGVQISAWMGIYGNAFDDATRQLAIDNIRALGGDVILDENGNVVEVRTPQE